MFEGFTALGVCKLMLITAAWVNTALIMISNLPYVRGKKHEEARCVQEI